MPLLRVCNWTVQLVGADLALHPFTHNGSGISNLAGNKAEVGMRDDQCPERGQADLAVPRIVGVMENTIDPSLSSLFESSTRTPVEPSIC